MAAAAVAGVGLSLAVATGEPIGDARWALLARLAVWAVAWGAGVVCAFRLPKRVAVPAVFAVAVALRLAALAGQPVLSDDLYRYAWDGRVQASGTDPYLHPPDSPELTGLREEWLWPDAEGCAGLQREEGCTRINRPSVRTIYPPVAQGWFAAVYRVAGVDVHHKAWQAAGLLTDLALIGLLPAVLRAWRRDERWTVLYALSPVPVVEVVNNGHVDGLAALLVVLALLAAARRRPVLVGALVGAAALVKIYPAVLALAFVAAVPAARRRAVLARVGGAAGALVALAYLPHVAASGLRVLGYLPGYLREERYDEGGRYLLAGLLGLPAWLTAVLAAGAVAAVAARLWWPPPATGDGQRGLARSSVASSRSAWATVPAGCAALLGALLLAVTPVQPWYALTLLAVATVAAAPAWAAVAVAGYPYFFAVILDSPHAVAIGRVSYGLALLVIVLAARSRTGRTTRMTGEVKVA
ncbi:MAG: glycosyltransferase 87 family protein [Acidimicrobiales bacterium]